MGGGKIVGVGDPRQYTSQFLFKGDFVKLKSINFGYTLPLSSKSKNLGQSIRLYVDLQNLYTRTKYPGWDPEGNQGSQWDLPQLFSASIGGSISF